MKLICYVRTFWRTLNSMCAWGTYVSGHNFVETDKKGRGQILTCETCGQESYGWF